MAGRDELIDRWRKLRESMMAQLALLESGQIRTRTNNVCDTEMSAARLRRDMAEFEELITKHESRDA